MPNDARKRLSEQLRLADRPIEWGLAEIAIALLAEVERLEGAQKTRAICTGSELERGIAEGK